MVQDSCQKIQNLCSGSSARRIVNHAQGFDLQSLAAAAQSQKVAACGEKY